MATKAVKKEIGYHQHDARTVASSTGCVCGRGETKKAKRMEGILKKTIKDMNSISSL